MRLTQFTGIVPKLDSQDGGPQGASVAENCELYGADIRPFMSPGGDFPIVDIDGKRVAFEVKTLHISDGVRIGFPEYTSIAPDPSERAGRESFLFVRDGQLWRSSGKWVVDGEGPELVGISHPKKAPLATVLVGKGTKREFPPITKDACFTPLPKPGTAPEPEPAPGEGEGNVRIGDDDVIVIEPEPVEPSEPEEPQTPPYNCVHDAPEARSYLLTYVTNCGEESAPSVPSQIVDVRNGDSVALVDPNTPPPNALYRRWYRSVVGTDGRGIWLFVAETPIEQPGFIDDVHPLALGEAMQTESHQPPPDCLQGVATFGDATVVVWSNDLIWLSEPRLPHAFPRRTEMKLPFPIVRVVGIPQAPEGDATWSAYALTTGTPFLLQGQQNANVVVRDIGVWEPAVNPSAVTSIEGGCAYASRFGLIILSGGSVQSVLNMHTTDIEWQDFNPDAMTLQYWNGRLWGFSPTLSFVFAASKYRRDRPPELVTITLHPSSAYAAPDTWLTLAFGDTAQEWERGTEPMLARWRTRTFTMPGHWWPASMKVTTGEVQERRIVREARAALANWESQYGRSRLCAFLDTHPQYATLEAELSRRPRNVAVRIFSDGRLYYERPTVGDKPFRVPARRRGIDWQFEVVTTKVVRELHVDTSTQDLTQLGLGVSNSV